MRGMFISFKLIIKLYMFRVQPPHYNIHIYICRSLRTLKQYVRNKARPEGSIAEAFIANKSLIFCSMYLHGIETKFNRTV